MSKKDFFKMSKEELEVMLGEAVKVEIARHHGMGISTTHGDAEGIYLLHPDGQREYIERYGGNNHDQG